MEGYCWTGQSPQWAVVPMEEEDVVHLCMLIAREMGNVKFASLRLYL